VSESVYLDRVATSSLDRSHYPSLLHANGRYYGDDYTRMKCHPDASAAASAFPARCRLHFDHHFLQPVLAAGADEQYPGTTNVAADGPEMPCCVGGLSDAAGINEDVSGTVVVAGDGLSYQHSTYPTVQLYDNRPSSSDSFHV